MEFNVTRASMRSSWPKDKSPCEGAIFKDNKWIVSIDTLEQFVDFFDDSIIFDGETVTIYDDYIE